jgi:hypothetical protein
MKLLKLSLLCVVVLLTGRSAVQAQTFLVGKSARSAPTAAVLTALAADPGSDLSALDADALATVAEIDARAYYAANPRSYTFGDYPIGEKRAQTHHLSGRVVERYCVVFFETLNSISN